MIIFMHIAQKLQIIHIIALYRGSKNHQNRFFYQKTPKLVYFHTDCKTKPTHFPFRKIDRPIHPSSTSFNFRTHSKSHIFPYIKHFTILFHPLYRGHPKTHTLLPPHHTLSRSKKRRKNFPPTTYTSFSSLDTQAKTIYSITKQIKIVYTNRN